MKMIIPVCAVTLTTIPLVAMTAHEVTEAPGVSVVGDGTTHSLPPSLRSLLNTTHDAHDHHDHHGGDPSPTGVSALLQRIGAINTATSHSRMEFDLSELTDGKIQGQAVIAVDGVDLDETNLEDMLSGLRERMGFGGGDVEIEVDLYMGDHGPDDDDDSPWSGNPADPRFGYDMVSSPHMFMDPRLMVAGMGMPGELVFGHTGVAAWDEHHDDWHDEGHHEFDDHGPEHEFQMMEREMHELHRHLEIHHDEMNDREREEMHRHIEHLRNRMARHHEMMSHGDEGDHGHDDGGFFHLAGEFVNKIHMSAEMADALNEREAVAVFSIWMARQQMSPEMRVETLSPMMNDDTLYMSVRNAATWVVMEAQGEMHRDSDQRQSLSDLIRRNGTREP